MLITVCRSSHAGVINIDDDADDNSSSVSWDLSRAALQVEQMVEARYRTAPLGNQLTSLLM